MTLRPRPLGHTIRHTMSLWEDGRETTPTRLEKTPLPGRICPVELRGEGFPIRVYGDEVPPMTGIAYDLAEFAVERFHQGGECYGTELASRTGSDRPIRLLMLKLEQPRFRPLARVLIWDARKGGTLRIIDPGPPC